MLAAYFAAAVLTVAWAAALLFYLRQIAINTAPRMDSTSPSAPSAESWKRPQCTSLAPITSFKCPTCGYSLK